MGEGAGISYVLADGVPPPAGSVLESPRGGALAAVLAKFNAAWAHSRYDPPSRLLPLAMRRRSTDLLRELLRKEGHRQRACPRAVRGGRRRNSAGGVALNRRRTRGPPGRDPRR